MRPLRMPIRTGDAGRRDGDSGADGARPAVRIVLAVPSRARIAGAAVASALSAPRGTVPVIALWHEEQDRAAPVGGDESGDVADDHASDRSGSRSVAGDDPAAPPPPWATPRARRAVGLVQRAGVEAVATANTVRVVLPADESQAVAAVERLAELPGPDPLVCVVARRWGSAWLRTVESAGAVHVAGTSSSVATSRATLRRHEVDVVAVPRPTGAIAAALLRAGWAGRGLVRSASGADDRDPSDAPEPRGVGGDSGQALLLVLLGLALAIILAGVLGAVAMAMSGREDRQRAVDVAALAAAAQLRAGSSYAFGSPRSAAELQRRAAAAARSTARENGVAAIDVEFPAGGAAAQTGGAAGRDGRAGAGVGAANRGVPISVRVRSAHRPTVAGVALASTVTATAEVAEPSYAEAVATGDEYAGPLAVRQGKPMRPDVALAFDRMNAAATAAGHPLTVTSGYRSNAEQARLFAAHPDPKWVARPGTSLHRLGTELDLGPASAYGWLAANSRRFGFLKRYSWEPWHFGFVRETASAHVAEQGRNPAAPPTSGAIPPWVPAAYRDLIRAASVRFKVSAAMLSAQLKAESDFDPRAVSSAGAQGIAQFMPGTAASVGLRDPFDPAQAIPAQARLMARLLRRFGSVPLALAAYNAGEGRVGACHCIPPYPETQRYVARIVALMRGYDDGADGSGLAIRLVA